MILQQFHVLPITLSPSINSEIVNDMRKALHYLVIGKGFLKGIHEYLSVVADDTTLKPVSYTHLTLPTICSV